MNARWTSGVCQCNLWMSELYSCEVGLCTLTLNATAVGSYLGLTAEPSGILDTLVRLGGSFRGTDARDRATPRHPAML